MPKIRKALTHAELMRAGIRNIDQLIESDGGQEKLAPEVKGLWSAVPQEIGQIKRMTERAKALLAVTFAQAKYWREQIDPDAKFAAGKRLAGKVSQWQEDEKKHQAKGGGARKVDANFDWLVEWQSVPELAAMPNHGISHA